MAKYIYCFLYILIFLPLADLNAKGEDAIIPNDSIPTAGAWYGKDYVAEIWDNSNGLPQNAVFAMDKDNTGYLWIATEEGLSRLDGSSTKVFDEENYPQMLEQTYYNFYKTGSGIWASADKSIALLEKTIQKVVDCKHITENTYIRALSEDENGNIWISTQKGKIHLWKDGVFDSLSYWNPDITLEMQDLFHLGNSRMLVGTTKGLFVINYKSKTVQLISPEDFIAYRIFGNPSAVFVADPDKGIYRLTENFNLELQISFDKLKDLNPRSLTTDAFNRIWASSTEKGLMMIENGDIKRFDYPEIKNYPVRTLIKEKENLYLGTHGKGLVIIKPAKVKQLVFPELQHKNIKAIYTSENQKIWIGTRSDGVYHLQNGQISSISSKHGLIQNGVNTIGGNKFFLYVGSSSGVSVIDLRSEKVIDHITQDDGLLSNYVNAIYGDSAGRIWILSRYGGMHYLDQNGKLQKAKLPVRFSNTNFTGILELENKDILISSTNQGVFRMVDGEFRENIPFPFEPGESIIYCMYEDHEGDLWFGTHGGIVLYRNGEFKRIKKSQGLKSQSVFSITGDGLNGVWISNNFGVQYIANLELKRFKDSQEKGFFVSSVFYNQSHGMPNSEANGLIFPSAMRDFDGKIWIPTVEGVGVIDPYETILEEDFAHFQWDELMVGDKKIPIGNEVIIPAKENMFQISFNTINFQNPSQYTLIYRIGEKSNSWLPLKDQRQFSFNGLKPGKHTLEVKILRFGKTESIQSLPIEKEAFIFETLGFKLLMLAFVCLLGYFLVKYYFNLRMKKDLENLVSQRTLELRTTNQKLKLAVSEIENQNNTLKEITWNQSHLVRAPLTKAMGINQLLINYPKYSQISKSREQLEHELYMALQQLDRIVRETHKKSENLREE